MTVSWNFPTRILFGEGALAELGPQADQLGATRALVVTDPGVLAAGVVGAVADALRSWSIQSETFHALSSNPTDEEALAATDAYAGSGANCVIAVGGGSAIDVAKIVRILSSHPLPLQRYDDAKGGSVRITAPLPPMVAIPTTAGTGSEVGRSAVVTMGATGRKTIFFAPNLIPSVAILDPVLTTGLPPAITAATGFDALTHNIEALCTTMDHPMAAAIALEGISLVGVNLVRAVDDGSDLAARGGMLKAALLGGVAFQKGLGACHSLAHPLSAELGMHHGLANALCLPATVEFNRAVAADKLALVAERLGARGDSPNELAHECAGTIRALRTRVGLPGGLRDAGVSESRLEHLATLAFEDPCHQENPRICTREELLALYRASM